VILFVLNILCDIIHDVIDKHVYFGQIRLSGQSETVLEMTGFGYCSEAWTY